MKNLQKKSISGFDSAYHVRVVEVVSDPTRNRSLRLVFRIRPLKKKNHFRMDPVQMKNLQKKSIAGFDSAYHVRVVEVVSDPARNRSIMVLVRDWIPSSP